VPPIHYPHIMCGIAGILRIQDPKDGLPPPHLESIPEAWLDTLDESIKHRGPDGAGRFRDRATREDGLVVDVALVHRRLSIIDHAGGHQPMVHDGERLRPDLTYGPGEPPKLAHELEPDKPLVAVVFNGCIYNHRELRAELESLGHRFETDHSDTEVLVHGWRAWREGSAYRLDSMHAVALWSRGNAEFVMGRDPAGEKPLYRAIDPFGSVVLASSAVPGVARLIGEHAYGGVRVRQPDFFCSDAELWVRDGSGPECPIGSLDITLPDKWELMTFGREDEYVRVDEVPFRSWKYPKRDGSKQGGDFAGAIDRAVAQRLEADVPLGVFLSGGIDSALIAAITKRHRQDTKTFTVRMPEASYDESEDAAETAAHIGTDHHTLDCDPNPADDLVTLIEQLGLPFGDSSLLPTYWVSKAAREHVKVALSGDGGDELFGGYRRHTVAGVFERWSWLLRCLPTNGLSRRSPSRHAAFASRLIDAAKGRGYPELVSVFSTTDFARLLGRQRESGLDPRMQLVAARAEANFPGTFAKDALQHDFRHYLPDDLLRKTDTASMAVGLEVRAPFLARELVEAALRTPLKTLMPNRERKGLLKQVARQYLPEHIVNRPKRGFAIPVGEWFRSDYGSMRTPALRPPRIGRPVPGLGRGGRRVEHSVRQADAPRARRGGGAEPEPLARAGPLAAAVHAAGAERLVQVACGASKRHPPGVNRAGVGDIRMSAGRDQQPLL
jgi:asparagine synthase (glutamine-hydrolysing)